MQQVHKATSSDHSPFHPLNPNHSRTTPTSLLTYPIALKMLNFLSSLLQDVTATFHSCMSDDAFSNFDTNSGHFPSPSLPAYAYYDPRAVAYDDSTTVMLFEINNPRVEEIEQFVRTSNAGADICGDSQDPFSDPPPPSYTSYISATSPTGTLSQPTSLSTTSSLPPYILVKHQRHQRNPSTNSQIPPLHQNPFTDGHGANVVGVGAIY